MLPLKLNELLHERVVDLVRNLRLIENVVTVAMMSYCFSELFYFCTNVIGYLWHASKQD